MNVIRSLMKYKVPGLSGLFLILLLQLLNISQALSQPCDLTTPSYNVNLSSKPDSVWTSPNVLRDGFCCTASGSDKCIEFNLTLSTGANGIQLDIVSGAVPGGALFYEISCGGSYQVGQAICLSGAGPHRITFCKPGNNTNVYQIRSIPKAELNGKLLVTQACQGKLYASGLVESSITWSSVPSNATHNSYLSCSSACDTVTVVPTGSYPSTVDYRVCGNVVGSCGSASFCDTVTMRFLNDISVDISPQNPTVCFGGSNTTITANPSGGYPPYRYLWNNGDTNRTRSVGVGTYIVEMSDSANCFKARDTVVVTAFSSSIQANAGNDTTLCTRRNYANLKGSVQAATGGKWMGGSGTYNPHDSSLTAVYTPSASETTAGSVSLRLLTRGNGSCPADTDTVVVSIRPTPVPAISGAATVCAHKTQVYTVAAVTTNTYQWTASGGTIIGSSTDTNVIVRWGAAGSGYVEMRQINPQSCDSTVRRNVTINATPVPLVNGPDSACAYKISSFYTASASGNTYQWTVSGGTIQGSSTDTLMRVLWGANGSGTVTIKRTNASNCDSSVTKNIVIKSSPVTTITGSDSVCVKDLVQYRAAVEANHTYQWTVSGGTIIGSSTDTVVKVNWTDSGTRSLSVKKVNDLGCDTTVSRTVKVFGRPVPILNGPDSVCAFKAYSYSSPGGGAAGDSYFWVVSGGAVLGSFSDSIVTIKWDSSGAGSLAVIRTSNKGCDSTVQKNVYKRRTPAPVISGRDTVCEGRSYVYRAGSFASDSYYWLVSGGTILGTNLDSVLEVRWGSQGTGSVILIQTAPGNCDSTVSKDVLIQPTPVPVISGVTNVCERKTYTYSVAKATGNTYQWTITGGTVQGASNDTSVRVFWNATGSGSVRVKQVNSEGCDSTVSRSITINPTPVPVLSGDTLVCEYKTVNYTVNKGTSNTYLWTVSGGTIIGSATDTVVSVRWSAAGSGNIQVRRTNSQGCDSAVSRSINIRVTPVPVISGPVNTCENKSYKYSVAGLAGHSYQWSATGGNVQGSSSDSTVTIIWGSAGAGRVTVKQTNSFGCDSTVNRNVTINPTPVPVISGSLVVCSHRQHVYTANTAPGYTYKWTITGGSINGSSTDTTVTVTWGTAGSGKLTLKETNSSSCDSSEFINVTVNPSPVPAFNGATTVCAHKREVYTVAAAFGNSYKWTAIGGTLESDDTAYVITVLWNNSGTGTLRLKQSNVNGCDSTLSKTITINPTPVPAISGKSTACESKLEQYITALVAGTTYKWTVPSGGSIIGADNGNIVNVRWNGVGTGSITLKLINGSGCDSMISQSIIIKGTPKPVISGMASVCEFKKFIYQVPPLSSTSYKWTVTGGTIIGPSTGNSVEVRWGPKGIGKVSLQETSLDGCDSTVSLNTNINVTPVPVINGPNPVCKYKIASYSAPSVASFLYNWTIVGGAIQGPNSLSSVNVLWSNLDTGKVILRITNNLGCDSTIEMMIFLQETPIPSVGGPPNVCEFSVHDYSVAAQLANSYSWSVEGGIIIGPSNNNALKVRWGQQGVGKITFRQTNSLGCDSTIIVPVIKKVKPKPSIQGNRKTCSYSKGNIYIVNPQPGHTYEWKTVDTAGTVSGSILSRTDSNAVDVQWGDPGFFDVVIKETDTVTGCDSTMAFRIFVDTLIQVNIDNQDTLVGCAPFSAIYTGTIPNKNNTFKWTFGDGYSSTDPNPTHIYLRSGTYHVKVISTNISGCRDTAKGLVTVHDLPHPNFTYTYEGNPVYVDEDTIYFSNTTTDADQFSWRWQVQLLKEDTSTASSPVNKVFYKLPGVYPVILKVTNSITGCSDSLVKFVDARVHESMFVPSAFSPNDDGINDAFFIDFENVVEFNISIFNRWGEIVFSSNDPKFIWRGKYKGEQVQEGAYPYLIEAKGYHGKTFIFKGIVHAVLH